MKEKSNHILWLVLGTVGIAAGFAGGLLGSQALGIESQKDASCDGGVNEVQKTNVALKIQGKDISYSELPFHVTSKVDGLKSDLLKQAKTSLENIALSYLETSVMLRKDKNQWVDVEELLKVEPSEEELKALFESVKAGMPQETTYESLKEQLLQYYYQVNGSKIREMMDKKREELLKKHQGKYEIIFKGESL